MSAEPGVPTQTRLETLRLADVAYDSLTSVLGFPKPLAPFEEDAFRIHLSALGEGGALPVRRSVTHLFDAVESVGIAGVGTPERSCALHASVTRAIASGISWAACPAEDAGTRRGIVEALVNLVAPCGDAALSTEAVSWAQEAPERAIFAVSRPGDGATHGGRPPLPAQSALFFEWLDGTRSPRPASALLGLWAAAATHTPVENRRWVNEPDTFDALTASLKGDRGRGADLGDLFHRFAIERLFLREATWSGTYRRVSELSKDHSIPWPSGPRHFLHTRPVATTGIVAIAVDLAARPKDSKQSLRAEIHWEDFAHFHFSWVTVDANGRLLRAAAIPVEARGTDANGSLANLEGAAQAILLGSSDGDPRYPFDPDDQVWEPHGIDFVIAAVGQ